MRRWRCVPFMIASLLVVSEGGLGETGVAAPRGGAAQLVKALSGEDALARFLAEERLVEMGDKAVPALEALATSRGFSPARRYAIHTLARIGTQKAIAVLLGILEHERDIRARGLACMHLGRMGVEEAVPIIRKWLSTIRGKRIARGRHPVVLTPTYEWMRHAHALREIGSEKGIPILEGMIKAGHGGPGGQALMRAYREGLLELRRGSAFRKAVRSIRGLERHVDVLFDFFRKDTLARIRLYRMKVVAGGLEGRWVLEDMRRHRDPKLRAAATTVLRAYDRLRRGRGGLK